MSSRAAEDEALATLLRALEARNYRFVTPTPATHARVLARPDRKRAGSLRDVLGWSLPFEPGLLEPELERLLRDGGGLVETADGLKSRYRVSSVRSRLYLHSAYPTEDEDAVFFGPDSYRFAAFIVAELGPASDEPVRLLDLGAGSGVGALAAADLRPGAELTLTDVNPKALRLARINAAVAGRTVETVVADGLEGVPGLWDLVLANPPYIADDEGREYRDGGDMHGGRLSLDLALEAAARLSPGGRLLLYTGAAIVNGRDALREALEEALPAAGCRVAYRELDPDVFGEELENPAYSDVERIAVVGAVATRMDPEGGARPGGQAADTLA